ncbi:MAG TPA: PSD1 and planctomycete cytochrome C domain-containing protein [Bryobacteraceae bacterium]|nr:PSD1 and planctomycete cytochrome C domain-containing protein [Bryobacteraceae bacterium]
MPRRPTLAACFAGAILTAGAVSAQTPVSFSKDIQPIFEASCWKCHGQTIQLSKLDLRTRQGALTGGIHGPSLVPGNPDSSRLFRMVSGAEKPAMPMDGKLTPAEVETIRRWIVEGATWDAGSVQTSAVPKSPPSDLEAGGVAPEARKSWAYQLPVKRPVPGKGHPVDAFLGVKWKERGLDPAAQADKTTLVRRAYFDLIGMPPSPAQVAEFVNDSSPDAWQNLIEKLLASPHYGERWGRHWLDVARYADSNGYEHDFDRPNAWRYRDYVIQSFNVDKPYNVFLREQIAGDEIEHVTSDSLIATGFLRSYAKVGYREKDNPEFRYEYLDDMIATVGRGVLGLTVQCARCHNHKFDPIPQKDYYKLQASLWGYVEVDHPLTSPEQAAAYRKQLDEVNARVNEIRAQIRTVEQPYRAVILAERYKKFPANVQQAIATPEAERTPGQVLLANQVTRTVSAPPAEIDKIMKPEDLEEKKRLAAEVVEIEKQRPAPIPLAMGITDGDYRFTPDGPGDEPAPGKGIKREATEGSFLHEGPDRYSPPPSHFLIRGDVNSRGSVMQPGFLTVATFGEPPVALPPANGRTSGRRLALAEWLTSKENPLTARVIVNRIWHHHFGRGIVAAVDNFGKMGEVPTHPELLDWLAVEFMDKGWSFKQMHRLLMTSEAYKMSSQFTSAKNMQADPENKLGWRFRARRLDAEAVRDSILAVSGALNREIGGPAVFPKLEAEVLTQLTNGIWRREEDGPKVWRRSVYIYRKRSMPFPMLESFDLPDQNISCGVRAVSTVPTQALMLMNDEFVVRQAELFADRVRETQPDPSKRIDTAYKIALNRAPDAKERQIGEEYLRDHNLAGLVHVLLNLNEFLYLR